MNLAPVLLLVVAAGITLRSLGYDQDRNLRILLRSAEGKSDLPPVLATELVDARVDVIE